MVQVSSAERPAPPIQLRPHRFRSPRSIWWLPRQLLTIFLAHALVLIIAYILLVIGDALFTAYAIVLRDALFVNYVARFGWMQQMAVEFKGAIAGTVVISAVLQMLFFAWRARTD